MRSARLKAFCKNCGVELEEAPKTQACGCPNMTTISTGKVTAVDLSLVVISQEELTVDEKPVKLTNADRQWQEERRQRKVRRLNYEVR